MKEEIAKTKWCPHIRFGDPNAPHGGNMIIKDDYADPRCIASDCMMWVWDDGKINTLGRLQAEGLGERVLENSGHCGLAK